jgi:protein-disulfide isomerase
MDHQHQTRQTKSFFDVIHSKQSFWLGFITAILSVGTLGFILLGSCVLGGECSVTILSANTGEEDVNDAREVAPTAAVAEAPNGAVPVVTEDDHIQGDKNAPITIIEYTDYECPYCERFHLTMLQIMEEYDGVVRWVTRDFPLSFHPNAESAAIASECAGEQDKFWEMGDALFENRTRLGEDLYIEIATELGLNLNEFTTCYESDEVRAEVQAEAAAGAKAGVTGTPGSFIIDQNGNATPIKGALPFETVSSAIDSML